MNKNLSKFSNLINLKILNEKIIIKDKIIREL